MSVAVLWSLAGPQTALADCEEGLDYSTCCFTRAVVGRVVRSSDAPDASSSRGDAVFVERSGDENVSTGDVVRLQTTNQMPPVGMRIVAVPKATDCDVNPRAEPCKRTYLVVRELDGSAVSCTIPPGVRTLSLSEGDAIELGFRSDCFQTLKTSLGYEPDEEVCTAGCQCDLARRSRVPKPGDDPHRQLAGLIVVGIVALSIGIRMRRRLRRRT